MERKRNEKKFLMTFSVLRLEAVPFAFKLCISICLLLDVSFSDSFFCLKTDKNNPWKIKFTITSSFFFRINFWINPFGITENHISCIASTLGWYIFFSSLVEVLYQWRKCRHFSRFCISLVITYIFLLWAKKIFLESCHAYPLYAYTHISCLCNTVWYIRYQRKWITGT